MREATINRQSNFTGRQQASPAYSAVLKENYSGFHRQSLKNDHYIFF